MTCFSIWPELTGSAGEGWAMELRDKQGPDQCQGKEFALYLESTGERLKVWGKVLISSDLHSRKMIPSVVWVMNGKAQLERILQWFGQERMSSWERGKCGRDMGERFRSRQVKTWQLLVCGGKGRRKAQGLIHQASWLRHMTGRWCPVRRWRSGGGAGLGQGYSALIMPRLLRASLISDEEIKTQNADVIYSNSPRQNSARGGTQT